MGFRLNLKWGGLSVQSPLSTSSASSLPSSYPCRCKDNYYLLARCSASSVLYWETEAPDDTSRSHVYSSSPQLLEKYYLGTREIKVMPRKGFDDSLQGHSTQISNCEDDLGYVSGSPATKTSQFRLLMKNLDILEDMFADSNALSLQRDILEQLGKLGAIHLFHSYLSRTLKSATSSDATTEVFEELQINDSVDNVVEKVIVHSGKLKLRKLRRKRTFEENGNSLQESLSEAIGKNPKNPKFASTRIVARSGNKRQKIAKNEAGMATGVKLVAELEKIRVMLEEETGEIVSFSIWAEAAGITKKELQQRLHYGWHCRDELVRSTRSLVSFIARNYWGLGIAFEDLIQAGNVGVLQGAERFDQSRGYKFSTYVQYWIRKSMSMLVARHARGVRIPGTLNKVINQVQKARKTLCTSNGKYPDDIEIAKFTGLSLAKIASASKCLRVVGSIDQKIGEFINTKYMEILPDESISTPEEAVIRHHMVHDIHVLLNGLDSRERQVLVLRFGLGSHQTKSLDEIGRLFCVSKEWIRKIEKTALTKLRNENSFKILRHYVLN